ncbi:MAG: hypothetical protein LBM66_00815 [Bifidobacteriaceae bacterium]|nr:hypothetical protein [Bifidobacteriaceae bacterium]
MVRRAFTLAAVAVAAAAAVIAVRRLQALSRATTARGMADAARGAGEKAQGLWAEIREAAVQREQELRDALLNVPAGGLPESRDAGLAQMRDAIGHLRNGRSGSASATDLPG